MVIQMNLKISRKTFINLLTFFLIAVLFYSYLIYFRPVKTVFLKGVAFSFREDLRKSLKVEAFPNEQEFHEAFVDYKIRNVSIVFKPGSPQTNAIYQIQAFELTYKLSRYDDIIRKPLQQKKVFSAAEVSSYDNITREENVLKIILVPPEFSDKTKVVVGGNRIWIYGKTPKEFDYATQKTILSIMNITSLEGFT